MHRKVPLVSRSGAGRLEGLELLDELEQLAILEPLELLAVCPNVGWSCLPQLGAKNQRPETSYQKLRLSGLQPHVMHAGWLTCTSAVAGLRSLVAGLGGNIARGGL